MIVVEFDGTKTVHAKFELNGRPFAVEIPPFPLCHCPPRRFESSRGCAWCAPHEKEVGNPMADK